MWSNPVKITAADLIDIPQWWIEEAAQPAANPDAFPSDAFLVARQAKMDEAFRDLDRSVRRKRKREAEEFEESTVLVDKGFHDFTGR